MPDEDDEVVAVPGMVAPIQSAQTADESESAEPDSPEPTDNKAKNEITPELAAKVLRKNRQNLVRKVADGKTLSPREQEYLNAIARGEETTAEPTFAKNQVALANALGVERKTIQRWVKEEGAPEARPNGQYHIGEWRSWATANHKKLGDDTPSQATLKARNLLLLNRKLEHHLKVLQGEYVPTKDVERTGAELGTQIRKVVTTLHLLAPSLVRCTSVDECEQILCDKEDEIIEALYSVSQTIEVMAKPKAGEVDASEFESATGEDEKDEEDDE